MKFLLPKEAAFYENFQQMSTCLSEMTALFQDFAAGYKDFESYSRRAKEIEHKADTIAHGVINLTNQSFITPFDREDIYRLVHELDDIVDLLENIIHSIYLYEMTEKKDFVNEFAQFIKEATEKLNALIKECFEKQKYTDLIWQLICDIHNLEDKGDAAYEKGLRKLFHEEADPIKVIKWKDILYTLEFIMDVYQKVSNTIEGIVVKSG
jgi:predicted phosphate transport protein (TIGR00153 family)